MFTFISLGLVVLPFAAAAVHDVQVGQGGVLTFTPDAIAADVGDQVVFHFNPKNHTVTQSSFADPCGFKDGGFDSGFMPVAANTTDNFPTYTITVNDTQPIWVFCDQAANTPASHCGQGMVFAVNCGLDGAANSFTNFQNSAKQIGASLSAAAASASATAAATEVASVTFTAAYGDITVPPAPAVTPVTATITLESSTWTTTYSSFADSPAATPASLEGVVHTVIVGGPGKLLFDPAHISAAPRDVIVFQFQQKNHTVTQSSFADPCRKLNVNGTTGFNSGFMPVADGVTDGFPTWNFTVTDTAPIWAYCRQQVPVSHCGSGMVFAVNSDENSARNFSAFQNVAEALNGTTTSSSASPSATTTSSNDASSFRMGVASFTVVFAALIALL